MEHIWVILFIFNLFVAGVNGLFAVLGAGIGRFLNGCVASASAIAAVFCGLMEWGLA